MARSPEKGYIVLPLSDDCKDEMTKAAQTKGNHGLHDKSDWHKADWNRIILGKIGDTYVYNDYHLAKLWVQSPGKRKEIVVIPPFSIPYSPVI